MAWVKDLYADEIRNGFLVTVDRKKIWNVELELLELLKSICRKHGIRYFAVNGTMLGAVRHRGFIPWDDDIDVGMLRPDYHKFLKAAAKEIQEPYFLQNMYSDRAIQFSKIQDLRTTAIEHADLPIHQGIFLDIFPFDAAPDGSKDMEAIYRMQKELWMAVKAPEDVRDGLRRGLGTEAGEEVLWKIVDRSLPERMDIFESFMEMHFDKSPYVGFFTDFMRLPEAKFDLAWLTESEEVPFEMTTVRVPKGYDPWLVKKYGRDYLEVKHWATAHEGAAFAVDVPYTEYLSRIDDMELSGSTGAMVQEPLWENTMALSCSSSGIVAADHPRQGIGDIAGAEFTGVMLDLSAYCPRQDLENYGVKKIRRKSAEVMEDVSALRRMAAPAAEFCRTSGLELAAMYAPYLQRNTKREDLNGLIEDLALESVRLCGQQGCAYLILRPLFAGIARDRLWEANRACYLRVAEEAKACNVRILLENQAADIHGHLVRGVCSEEQEAVRWVDELNAACGEMRFGFCLDVGTASLCGQNLYEFVKTVGKRLEMVILRDVDGREDTALLPFTGVGRGQSKTDWLNLVRGLRETAFHGKMVISLAGTASSFSPLLRPSLLGLAKAAGDYICWQVDMERILAQYDRRVLFGAGNMCRAYMKCYGEQYPPLFTCDNNQKMWGAEFCGLEVRPPEELRKLPGDCAIFICNIYYREIEQQLRDMGLRNPILCFNDEYLPSFHFDRLDDMVEKTGKGARDEGDRNG